MRNLIDILDFTVEELDQLIHVGAQIAEEPAAFSDRCRGKKLASLFFEPSTRTRLSFEAAMYELGGSVIGFSEAANSSVAKGESIADTIRTVSCYADIIAMRTPMEGAPLVAAQNASIPVINGGDGGHKHPTQTLADLLTIYREMGRFDNLTLGLCGDLKNGRTVHSLIDAMTRYPGVKFVLISPAELRIPAYVRETVLDPLQIQYTETTDLEGSMAELDILYMTRIQRERFDDPAEYERLKNSYVLDPAKMEKAKENMRVLHPLPRVNEISVAVDKDHRAAYFRQALNGKYMRMALIMMLLDEAERTGYGMGAHMDSAQAKPASQVLGIDPGEIVTGLRCQNAKCISAKEQELPHLFRHHPADQALRCIYCDSKGVQ